jgi:tRNA 2-thiouridine synthesizing protein A
MSDETTLDLKGLLCPLPVLRTQKAMRALAPGTRVTVLATDPGAVKDFAAFASAGGHQLLESSEAAGVYRFRLQKGG